MTTLYTIGHSTRALEELIEALRAHGIQVLVDVRAFPMSRRLPHFNRESLDAALPAAGIEYRWMRALGGRRKKLRDDSPNVALRNEQFRNYADYMLTPEFQSAAAEVLGLAAARPTAIMCAERVWFHCHRMLISDYVVAGGGRVLHIDDAKPPREHKLTADARIKDGSLVYSGDRLF